MVGVTPQAIQAMEDPAREIEGSRYVLQIARALKVQPEWLQTGKGPKGYGETAPAERATHDLLVRLHVHGAHGIDRAFFDPAFVRSMTDAPLAKVSIYIASGRWCFTDTRVTRVASPGVYVQQTEGGYVAKKFRASRAPVLGRVVASVHRQ